MDEGFFYGEPGSNPRASTGSSLLISRYGKIKRRVEYRNGEGF
jgi:hypothetical protein